MSYRQAALRLSVSVRAESRITHWNVTRNTGRVVSEAAAIDEHIARHNIGNAVLSAARSY